MTRWLLRRLVLSLITLWLLATLVFIITNILPNDIGRTILGPFAPQESVDALNERLGTNAPLIEQYGRAMRSLVTLDWGNSFQNGKPVTPLMLSAISRSGILAAYALVLTIPIAIIAGLFAGRRRDRRSDRAIVLFGLTFSSIPEFVIGTILVVVLGVQFKLLPVLATPPANASVLDLARFLLMPALAMALVYFGCIARIPVPAPSKCSSLTTSGPPR